MRRRRRKADFDGNAAQMRVVKRNSRQTAGAFVSDVTRLSRRIVKRKQRRERREGREGRTNLKVNQTYASVGKQSFGNQFGSFLTESVVTDVQKRYTCIHFDEFGDTLCACRTNLVILLGAIRYSSVTLIIID
jgi:hypothetical protein